MISEAASAFGKFVLIERLANGKTGEVLLARSRGPFGFKKIVVVKRVPRDGPHAKSGTFLEEAAIAARLSHPHIAQVFEMGDIDTWSYLAREYVSGLTLREVLGKMKPAPEQVAHLFTQLCSALAAAHDNGVVHRNIEPSNILVSFAGDVKLIDFGSARSGGADHTEIDGNTRPVAYMSPEQNAAEDVDARSDVFSVGVCLYEALTGSSPFAFDNPVEAFDAVRRKKVAPVSKANRKLAAYDALVAKALAKNPEERFADARAMAEALRDIARSLEPDAPLERTMRRAFEDEIADEKNLVDVAMTDGDTNIERRPTSVEGFVVRRGPSRGVLIGGAASGFVLTVLVTALVTRAVVASDVDVNDPEVQRVLTAGVEPLQPKFDELVVKSGKLEAAKADNVATEPAAEPPSLEAPKDEPAKAKKAVPRSEPRAAPPPPKPVLEPTPEAKPAAETKTAPSAAPEPKAKAAAAAPEPKPTPVKTKPTKKVVEEEHDWTKDPTPDVVEDEDE